MPCCCLLAHITSAEKSAVILCSFWNGSFFPLVVAFEMFALSLVFSAWILGVQMYIFFRGGGCLFCLGFLSISVLCFDAFPYFGRILNHHCNYF